MPPDDDAVTAAAQPRDRAAENSLSIASGGAARPQLLRALNGQLILEHIRQRGPCTRAELARVTGLSKPTVSLALSKAERGGLVREAGQRTGVPGRSALLYEVRPSAGYVLGLHAGHRHLRGAAMDMMQT
ncbi:MAG: MarR family transcriptional regulator, partial [Nocardiopsaceae bacterium]|nr:MarR family transcriptional regulator [Nocardiopsaceae bacterium]